MKNFDATDRVNFFTRRAPDFFAIWIRIRGIGLMDQIVKEPAGNHYPFVQYTLGEKAALMGIMGDRQARHNANVTAF